MDTLLQDIRYALRTLRRSPGFAAVAAITLALGIGANTAIFSVVDTVLLKPLPFAEPDRLVTVWENNNGKAGHEQVPVNPGTFLDWRREARAFQSLAAWQETEVNLTGGGEPVRSPAAVASGDLFSTLRAAPVVGRGFARADEAPGAEPVVVLSHALWTARFGGDREVVGRTISVDGVSRQVVGVMPAGFRYPEGAELWIPFTFGPEAADFRGSHFLTVVGRLRPGATLEAASAEVAGLSARIAQEFPDTNQGWGALAVPMADHGVGSVRAALLVLLGAVGLILLIACANVGNLLLARAAARHREVAVRAALGAGRGRLVRQLLTESVILAAAGGVLGLTLAAWMVQGIVSLAGDALPRAGEIGLDLRVLAFTFGVALLSGVLFGLAPALQVAGGPLHDGLKEGGRGGTGGVRAQRLRAGLVVTEVALSLVLLVGAGLLLKSFARLVDTDPGFRVEQLLAARVSLPHARYGEPGQAADFVRDVSARAASLPGVRAVAVGTSLPLGGNRTMLGAFEEGRPPATQAEMTIAGFDAVTPGYFATLGIPLRSGRDLSPTDREGTPHVALINETLARSLFGDEDPIGKRVVLTDPHGAREVVGVVGDVRQDGLAQEAGPRAYVSVEQAPQTGLEFVLRTSGDPTALAAAFRAQVLAVDPDQPVAEIRTMEQVAMASVSDSRMSTMLLGSFAGLGIVLAAIGLYGVVSYSVATRTRELGIRLALGAAPGQVLRLVMREGLGLAVGGVALGLVGAYAASRVLGSLLHDVSPTDPLVFGAVAALLAGVAALASWLPGSRAARVDPAVAFREP